MHRLTSNVKEVWKALASRYTANENLINELYHDLVHHYSEPQRYYHNLDHIQALLRLFAQYQDSLVGQEIVLFSIFYHDVIYIPGRVDNEYQSALVAKNALEQLGVPQDQIEEVQFYINTTSGHKIPQSAPRDLRFFIDFDLSILAAEQHDYLDYLLRIRKEFGFLSTQHFASGRKTFIQNLLEQPYIFCTREFQSIEAKARKNMQWELEMSPGIFSAC
jgi:predicted metal-dependent HD superfamily phosphohydrolase